MPDEIIVFSEMDTPSSDTGPPGLGWLEEQQRHDPTNLVWAHDLGLAHYCQARKETPEPASAEHWRRVVANWTTVLENERYWREWGAERGRVYGKQVHDDHLSDVREALGERLAAEMAASDAEGAGELEALFHLERRGARLLRQAGGLKLPGRDPVGLDCGPLFVRQLALENRLEELFRGEPPHREPSVAESLEAIVAWVQPEDDRQTPAPSRQLSLCFSRLGLAWIHLERRAPRRALRALAEAQCADCQTDHQDQLPTRCRPDCVEFARANPAYALSPRGSAIFFRHAVELAVGAHLLVVQEDLRSASAGPETRRQHLQDALALSAAIGLRDELTKRLGDLLLGWADALAKEKRLDEAIRLIEGATDLFTGEPFAGERLRGKLASLFNLRGVEHANEKRWPDAVHDLRRASENNPHVPLYRDNLGQALHGHADAAYKAGDDELARQLLNEATQLHDSAPPAGSATVETLPAPADEPPAPELRLEEAQRAHPALFDARGLLKAEVLDESGRAVLEAACELSAALGEPLLRPPALLAALARFAGGETTRLLRLQGVLPQRLEECALARDADGAKPLASPPTLSQFNLWFSVLEALELAWDVAQFDRGWIGEPHLLYGLLISRNGSRILREAGLDVKRMIDQAGWHE